MLEALLDLLVVMCGGLLPPPNPPIPCPVELVASEEGPNAFAALDAVCFSAIRTWPGAAPVDLLGLLLLEPLLEEVALPRFARCSGGVSVRVGSGPASGACRGAAIPSSPISSASESDVDGEGAPDEPMSSA